jgi:GAF domain-containing protein
MDYKALTAQVRALTEGVPYEIANLANVSAAIWQEMKNINWAGFYRMHQGKLVLGPFQGKPACIEIPVGRGVCGTAVQEKRTILVEDVHAFPGHIACDSASNSEIVVPIFKNGGVYGVLDIDSPYLARFTREDQSGLEELVRTLEETLFS